jgi:hypothetical protein
MKKKTTTQKKRATKKVARKAAVTLRKARDKRVMPNLAEPVNVKARLRQAFDRELASAAKTLEGGGYKPLDTLRREADKTIAAIASVEAGGGVTLPPAPIAQAWRASIDWVAAGKKAYETRMRNLAARAANGGAPVPTPAPRAPKVLSRIPAGPLSEADYVLKLTAAINRTVRKGDEDRIAAVIGKDMGGGWLVVATDGHRALTQKATKDDAIIPHGKLAIMKAGKATFGVTLTPALEQAIGLARLGVDKKKPGVRLTFKQKTLTISGAHLAEPIVRPLERALPKAAPSVLHCDVRFLADAMGRGGRLGWERPNTTKGKPIAPAYVVEVSDQVRYVFMPMVGGQ